MDKQKFTLHLPGLLKVLAEHLYSTKRVAVRELLQNAHDSCVRRRIEHAESDFQPRIELVTDARTRTLSFRDNGCGLTEEEINEYLATIGRGYTRELRERLALSSPDEAAELIGQFGLGFLSAFLLATEVNVTTRSIRGGPTLCWHSTGDEFFDLHPTEDTATGTTVTLHLKPAVAFILQERNLIDTVRTYADFLPTPIYLAGDEVPLNLMTPPWEDADSSDAINRYVERAFPGTEPLYILRLRDWKVAVGRGQLTIPMQGFLFVPPASVASVREYGDLTVYIRRMFICDRERDLMPPWARFVRGVIDCPVLQPTASREGVHQDEHFDSVRQALEEQLSEGLRRLAQDEPARWKRLVTGHSDVIVSWAVKDNEFFERVQDIVPFRTTRGLLSLPDYLRVSGGSLYYVTRELGSLQEQVLAEGRDVPAIDASWFAVAPFLEKYASRHVGVGLAKLDSAAEDLMRPVAEDRFAPLLAYFREQGVSARAAAFRPVDLPALMVYRPGAETVREAQAALAGKELPEGLAALVSNYVDDRLRAGLDLQGTLYLNASCPIIVRLAEARPSPGRDALLNVLHQQARLFCGRMMNAADATAAFGKITGALETLLGEPESKP